MGLTLEGEEIWHFKYFEIIRDYAPVAAGTAMIIDVEFLDDTTLCLEYYSGEEW